MDAEPHIAKIASDKLAGLSFERLYRLEIQKKQSPGAFASEPTRPQSRFARVGKHAPSVDEPPKPQEDPAWSRVGLVYDVFDRSPTQLIDDAMALLEGETGEFRILVYYWDGQMERPEPGKIMGKGDDFMYSKNPRGDIVLLADQMIEFELEQ